MFDWLIGLGSLVAMGLILAALMSDPLAVEIPDDIPGSEAP